MTLQHSEAVERLPGGAARVRKDAAEMQNRMDFESERIVGAAGPSVGRTHNSGRQSRDLLEWLLEYELRAASRYRRFVTLVLVDLPPGRRELGRQIADNVRSCDEYFELDSTVAILMGETDLHGALAAIERFKNRLREGRELRYALAVYPSDASVPGGLIAAVQRRLERARHDEAGAVAATG